MSSTVMPPTIHQIRLLLRADGGGMLRRLPSGAVPREKPGRYDVDDPEWLRVTVRRRLAINRYPSHSFSEFDSAREDCLTQDQCVGAGGSRGIDAGRVSRAARELQLEIMLAHERGESIDAVDGPVRHDEPTNAFGGKHRH